MAADPEPGDGIIVHDANGPVTERHPGRPDVLRFVDALKAQRWMERVIRPKTVCLLCSFPYICGKLAVALPKRRQGR